jgi:hypothetical protein
LSFLLAFFCLHHAGAQSVASVSQPDIFTPSFTRAARSFDKFVSVHVAPTKAICGELPVTLAMRLSYSWMVELGAGPSFRDRVSEKLFNGRKLQNLAFENSHASYDIGYAVYAGARYLLSKSVLQGFYVVPEISYVQRNASYPVHATPQSYDGRIREANARLLLGYDRAWCDYSQHVFYGGFFGCGLRRYDADYFNGSSTFDPGTQHTVETIPTLHLGYRVGYKF